MTKEVQIRGHEAAAANAFIGEEREVTVDTTNWELRVHDGTTPGGHRLPNRDSNDNRYQARSVELDGLLGWEPNERGLVTRLGPANYALRAITVDESGLNISTNNGYSGDFVVSLNDTIDGDRTATGTWTFNNTILAAGGVTGNLVGNVTGNLTGNVTGNLTGNVTGNLTGNVTGNLTGSVIGDADFTGGTVIFDEGAIQPAAILGLGDMIHTYGFPEGAIVMWSGPESEIPDGWFLCDGLNSTPDLRNRFVVGAGNGADYLVGDLGGIQTSSPVVNVESAGGHSHALSGSALSASTGATISTTSVTPNNSAHHVSVISSVSLTDPGHSHTLGGSVESAGSHTHTASTSVIDNRPPFWALCYIMKGGPVGVLIPADVPDENLRSDLLSMAGSGQIGHISDRPNAVATTVQKKLRESVSVTSDFFASPLGAVDVVDEFNNATRASTALSDALFIELTVPSGSYNCGGDNKSIFLRAGQSMRGSGSSTRLDFSQNSSNTLPYFVLGSRQDGVLDSTVLGYPGGGQPIAVSNLFTFGGSGTAPNFYVKHAGWSFTDLFMTGAGIGIRADGSDGSIESCKFDLGLTHIELVGQNITISGGLSYMPNYGIRVSGSNAGNNRILGMNFEYFRYAAILIEGGASAEALLISSCSFIQTTIEATTDAAIAIRGAATMTVANTIARNIHGPFIRLAHSGTLTIISPTIDGIPHDPSKPYSTNMQALVTHTGGFVTWNGGFVTHLPGQPVEIGGVDPITVILNSITFWGNTGGTADIRLSNTHPNTRIIVQNCRSDRTLIEEVAGFSGVLEVIGSQAPDTGWGQFFGPREKSDYVMYSAAGTPVISNPPTQAQVQAIADYFSAFERRLTTLHDIARTQGWVERI